MRQSAKSLHRVAILVTCFAVSAGSLAGCSSSTSTDATATPTPSASPAVAREAGIEGEIAETVLKGIGGGAFGWAAGQALSAIFGTVATSAPGVDMTQTNQKLDDLASQVAAVSGQIVGVSTQVKAVANQIDAEFKDVAMKDTIEEGGRIAAFHRTYYVPLVNAAVDLQKATLAGTDKTVELTAYDEAKRDFKNGYASYQIDAIPLRLHQQLMPNSGFTSLLNQAGKVMMDKGYVNHDDSINLISLYKSVADWEAAGTLMVLEYQNLLGRSGDYVGRAQEYLDWYYDEQERALPPEFPEGHVLITPGASTVGVPEFFAPHMASGVNLTNFYACRHVPTCTPEQAVEDRALGTEVDKIVAANPGWLVPSEAQLTALSDAVHVTGQPILNLMNDMVGSGDGAGSADWHQALTDSGSSVPGVNGSLWVNPEGQWRLECAATRDDPDIFKSVAWTTLGYTQRMMMGFTTTFVSADMNNRVLDYTAVLPDHPTFGRDATPCIATTQPGGLLLTQPSKVDYMAQTNTVIRTVDRVPLPTPSPVVTPTATPTSSSTPTATPSASATPTAAPSAMPTPTPTPTTTPTPSPTRTIAAGRDIGKRTEAESFDTADGVSRTDSGGYIGNITNGDSVGYTGVYFTAGSDTVCRARVSSGEPDATGAIEWHLDSPSGPLVSSMAVKDTGGWDTWTTVSSTKPSTPGFHDLYLVFTSPQKLDFLNVDWIECGG